MGFQVLFTFRLFEAHNTSEKGTKLTLFYVLVSTYAYYAYVFFIFKKKHGNLESDQIMNATVLNAARCDA